MKFQEEIIFEKGKVVGIQNNRVIVEVERSFNCKGCSLEPFCMTGNANKTTFELINTLQAKKHDKVSFELNPGSRILSSFLIFIMPIIVLFLIYFFSKDLLLLSENVSILLSLISWGLSFLLLKFFNSRLRKTNFLKPKMVEIISN